MRKLLALLTSIILLSNISYSQAVINSAKQETHQSRKTQVNPDFCATGYIHEEKMVNDKAYKKRYLKMDKKLEQMLTNKNPVNGIYQVPIVVHVMHKGEAVGSGTNISDADVKVGIKYLNTFWRKVAGSIGDGDGVDMKIEFVFAVQDENGNCTDGIDRVDMSGVPAYVNNGVNVRTTNGLPDYNADRAINSLKEYSVWDPKAFYNVWLVDEIDNENCLNSNGGFTGGYAYLPYMHGELNDGSVVLICSYLDKSSTVWAHEMGHAFNLPHTFDGDDVNRDGIADRCGDDGILDTPPHMRTSSSPAIYFDCTNSTPNACSPGFNQEINPDNGFRRNTGTYQDHMHNYMDYSGCTNEFTGGQRTVAQNALIGARGSYLAGYALTPSLPAAVGFSATSSASCLGGSISFTDESTCTPNAYTNTGYIGITFSWTFDNGINIPYTSTDQNPTITFTNPGAYDVTLEITNPQGTTDLTKTSYITISTPKASICVPKLEQTFGPYNYTIWNVKLNTIDNRTSTFSNGPNGYEDYSCSINTTLNSGASYDLTIGAKAGFSFNEAFCVWIDWDNNGTFETLNGSGVNEKVFSGNTPQNTSNTFTQRITVPASAVTKAMLRMRVFGDAFALTDNEMLCVNVNDSLYIGDIEDYGVIIKAAPATPIITTQPKTVNGCAGNTEFFTIVANSGTYQWQENTGTGGFKNITNGAIYSGATSPTLTLTTITAPMDKYKYRCVVTDGAFFINSNKVQLTVNAPSTGTDTRIECNAFKWLDDNVYTSNNNTATFNMLAANGCDSLVTLNLTINVSDITTSVTGATITSNSNSATYAWLDCDNKNSLIAGETSKSYTATANGNYAVELTENGCVDTSTCVSVTVTGLIENSFKESIHVSPNPTTGNLTIELGNIHEILFTRLLSLSGQLIETKKFESTNFISTEINQPNGIYMLEISDTNGNKAVLKLIKQ